IHFDICYLFRKVGITGGLKEIEKRFGISRSESEGLDGLGAVILWKRYEETKNKKYLETLLAYNNEEVINLEFLLRQAYNRLIQKTNYEVFLLSSIKNPPVKNPYSADQDVIAEIQAKTSHFSE
ncbi:MAG: ribonuclease H-like domain-containing protein, partial [Promethearchaeota archaeon]